MHTINNKNVDPKEQQKFAKLAPSWWDVDGPMRPLHQINPLRMQFILQYAAIDGQNVVDIGCGAGILSESLAKEQAKVTAIDINPELIAEALKHSVQQNLTIDYRAGDVEALVAEKQTFSVVTCMELLEHVPNPTLLVNQCAKLLKPGGQIFFSTINRTFKSFMGAIVAAEYVLQWLPRGTHHYSQFIQPAELTAWANQANLHLVSLQGISYQPLTGQFKFSSDLTINYLACFELS